MTYEFITHDKATCEGAVPTATVGIMVRCRKTACWVIIDEETRDIGWACNEHKLITELG